MYNMYNIYNMYNMYTSIETTREDHEKHKQPEAPPPHKGIEVKGFHMFVIHFHVFFCILSCVF